MAGTTLVTGIVGNVHVYFHVIFMLKSVKDNTLSRTFITVKKDTDTASHKGKVASSPHGAGCSKLISSYFHLVPFRYHVYQKPFFMNTLLLLISLLSC